MHWAPAVDSDVQTWLIYVNVDVISYLILFHSDSLMMMMMMMMIMSLLLQLVMINAYNSCTSGVFSNGDFL